MIQCFYYAPNFKEVEGAYWFGPVSLSVRLSITPFVGCKTRELLVLGTWNYIYSISTKNKQTHIFFFFGRTLYGKVMPLFRLGHKKLVNMITWEPLELGFSYLAYGLGLMFRWPDKLLSEFREILTKFCPFFDFTIIAMEKPCQHDILRTTWARILIFGIWLRINV